MACILKQDKLYPETETLYPETEYFVSVLGNKIPCFAIQSFYFRIQIILFRKQVCTGLKTEQNLSLQSTVHYKGLSTLVSETG